MSYTGFALLTLYKNVPFSNTYSDHPFCIQHPAKTSKFLDIVDENNVYSYDRLTIPMNVNFNFNNLIETSIKVQIPQNNNGFVNSNYLKVTTADKDYYYFIVGVDQKNVEVYTFNLELDVFMTYATELRDALQNKPLMTSRKMCYRFSNALPFNQFKCRDLFKNEQITNGIKSNIIKNVYETTQRSLLKDFNWIYFSLANTSEQTTGVHETTVVKGIQYPYQTFVTTQDKIIQIKLLDENGNDTGDEIFLNPSYTSYYNDNNILGVKASNYFVSNIDDATLEYDDYARQYVLTLPKSMWQRGYFDDTRKINISNNTIILKLDGNVYAVVNGALQVVISDNNIKEYNSIILGNSITKPTIDTLRNNIYEPKLFVSPVKKYVLTSAYSKGVEIFPTYSYIMQSSNLPILGLKTYCTPLPSDNNIYTTIRFSNINNDPYQYSIKCKLGLYGTPNYTLPTAKNALDYFVQTQGASYYAGKTASSINGFINAFAKGVENPSRALTSSVSAVTNFATNIQTSLAYVTDLENTPESVSGGGFNYSADDILDTIEPYVIEYGVTSEVENTLLDYYYNYGYNVTKECYFTFNKDFVNNGNNEDDYLFTRTLFNYIQLNENIVDKLNIEKSEVAIPNAVKEKLNEVLNNGIKLWVFFDYHYWFINENMQYEFINKYYLKSNYENAEI